MKIFKRTYDPPGWLYDRTVDTSCGIYFYIGGEEGRMDSNGEIRFLPVVPLPEPSIVCSRDPKTWNKFVKLLDSPALPDCNPDIYNAISGADEMKDEPSSDSDNQNYLFDLAESLDNAQRIRMDGSIEIAVQITEVKATEVADTLRRIAVLLQKE